MLFFTLLLYAFSEAKRFMTHGCVFRFLFHFNVISASNCRINQLLSSSVPNTVHHSVLPEVAANYFLAVFRIVSVLPVSLFLCLRDWAWRYIASGLLYCDPIFKKLLTLAGHFQSLTNSNIGLLKIIVAGGLC